MCGTLNKVKRNAMEGSKMDRELTPIVFAVNCEYQIMMYVESPSLMWVQVGDRTFYDESNGIMRSNVTIHRVYVPMELLDKEKSYRVFIRKVIDRKPYFPEFEDVVETAYDFRPVPTSGKVRGYHVSDSHNRVDGPTVAADCYGNIDFLVLNGDLADHTHSVENCLVFYKIASKITKGNIPTIFSRGNHDTRGVMAERFCEYTPTDRGKTYYTFRIGCVWGIVLDCGEDKVDEHKEYGGTVCFHQFREKETEFIKDVIARAEEEYLAEGVQYRLVIAHNPFTVIHKAPFDIEQDLYREWIRLIGENIRPHALLGGHMHCLKVIRPGDDLDHFGQLFPTVVGSVVKGQDPYYAGAGFELQKERMIITFTDSQGTVLNEDSI